MLWTLLLLSLIDFTGGTYLNDNGTAICNNTANSTLKGNTTQSSSYSDGKITLYSDRAIDGNMTTCAHTSEMVNSWWRIDLLGVYNISCIAIYNKNHGNANIKGSQIFIGNSREIPPLMSTDTNTHVKITKFTMGSYNCFNFNGEAVGRYVTVLTPGSHFTVLCDVKIWGSLKESPFVLINQSKTWEEALHYCRDNDMDLASILDEKDQVWAELEAKKANSPHVWLGLRYTCTLDFWFWIEDHDLNYNCFKGEKVNECGMSVAMDVKGEHFWSSKPDTEKFNFICTKKEN
ncbi:fucolectin-5-like isoform X2 [Seriola dumerili]|nr:fucolectin-5-like isoform X2 [Seriola dumerili]